MLLLGEKVTGADAADWGLIHAAVDAAELDAAADELLARLASGPTVAIGLAKQALHYGQHATLSQSMSAGTLQSRTLLPDSDFKEGLAAFRQRRAPDFQGRVDPARRREHTWPHDLRDRSTPSPTRSTATQPPSR